VVFLGSGVGDRDGQDYFIIASHPDKPNGKKYSLLPSGPWGPWIDFDTLEAAQAAAENLPAHMRV
jgi:hypothetical protein